MGISTGWSPRATISKREMVFVDGENLVFRYQAMIGEGRKPKSETKHIPDAFIWASVLEPSGMNDGLRVGYYTSAVGDEDGINKLRDEISSVLFRGIGLSWKVCAQVFKKPASSRKTKLVDMSICIDALRHAFQDDLDIVTLVTGDGDFVPLVREIQRRGKLVHIKALSNGLEPELQRIADSFTLLDSHFVETASGG